MSFYLFLHKEADSMVSMVFPVTNSKSLPCVSGSPRVLRCPSESLEPAWKQPGTSMTRLNALHCPLCLAAKSLTLGAGRNS